MPFLPESFQVPFICGALDGALRSRTPIPSRDERVRRALDVVGRFHSGCGDGSIRHDDYLAEAYRP